MIQNNNEAKWGYKFDGMQELNLRSSNKAESIELNFLKKFPEELIVKIFSYLSYPYLCQISLVCRQWNCIAADHQLWSLSNFLFPGKKKGKEAYRHELSILNRFNNLAPTTKRIQLPFVISTLHLMEKHAIVSSSSGFRLLELKSGQLSKYYPPFAAPNNSCLKFFSCQEQIISCYLHPSQNIIYTCSIHQPQTALTKKMIEGKLVSALIGSKLYFSQNKEGRLHLISYNIKTKGIEEIDLAGIFAASGNATLAPIFMPAAKPPLLQVIDDESGLILRYDRTLLKIDLNSGQVQEIITLNSMQAEIDYIDKKVIAETALEDSALYIIDVQRPSSSFHVKNPIYQQQRQLWLQPSQFYSYDQAIIQFNLSLGMGFIWDQAMQSVKGSFKLPEPPSLLLYEMSTIVLSGQQMAIKYGCNAQLLLVDLEIADEIKKTTQVKRF